MKWLQKLISVGDCCTFKTDLAMYGLGEILANGKKEVTCCVIDYSKG